MSQTCGWQGSVGDTPGTYQRAYEIDKGECEQDIDANIVGEQWYRNKAWYTYSAPAIDWRYVRDRMNEDDDAYTAKATDDKKYSGQP